MAKRILVLILSLILVLTLLVACAGNGDDTPAPDAAADDVEAADPVQQDEGNTLTVWTWKVAMVPAFEAAGEIFYERYGIRVEAVAASPDDVHRQRVIAAANSGDLPDVVHWWAARGKGFENALVNMRARGEDAAFMDGFSAVAFNNSIVRDRDVEGWADNPETCEVVRSLEEGDLFQIPIDMGGFFTIYGNNRILSQVGLENRVPTYLCEFIDFAETVSNETDYGGFIWAAGLSDVYYNWMGQAVESMFLGPEVSAGLIMREELMSDPRNIQPLKMFEEMATRGIFLDGIITMDIDEGDMAFAAGLGAYLLGGTFTYGQLRAMGMDMDDVFSFVVPVMRDSVIPGSFHINGFPLTGLSIAQNSTMQDAAMRFIELVALDPDGIVAFYNAAYLLPVARLDAATAERLDVSIRTMFNSLSDEPNSATQVWYVPGRTAGRRLEWNELYSDMQRIVTGEITAEEAAANFDANAAAQEAAGH